MNEAKKLVIIDGKSVFYRGYYAMPNLATAEGIPTGGVFGFATMALEVIKRLRPDYVCVAWDKPKTNIRRRLELYPAYKAGRKPAPADFYDQVPILHELLKSLGWPLYELDDYEADDIMGTLACQASALDIKTMLITSDLDMLQLVDSHVHVYLLKKGLSNIELYSPTSFEAKYGLKVAQFLDLKSLKGDASDNIPGVPGIGEKTAINLLKQYQTLDNIYQNIELIPDSLKKKLINGKDLAYLSKKLAAIWTDAPLKLNLQDMDGSKINTKELVVLLKRLEFRSLINRLPTDITTKIDADYEQGQAINKSIKKSILIDNDQDLALIDFVEAKQTFITSRALGLQGQNPTHIVFSFNGDQTYIIDVKKINKDRLRAFINNLPPFVGHNLKPTLKLLINLGSKTPKVHHDTLIAGFVLNSLRRELSLTQMAEADLGYQGVPLDELDQDLFIERSAIIITLIKTLTDQQMRKLEDVSAFIKLLQEIEWPIIPVLAKMELAGIELDTAYLKKFSERINDIISDLQQQIYGYADQEFNISSPMQLADILFNKLKLPLNGVKKGKNGYSTAANELDKLRNEHPIIDLISSYREITKLKNTYVDTLPKQVDSNSRLHTTFNLTIAQTGRLSSTDPNLQNIPIRTELGREIRSAFIAGKNKKLISADYSQFELRLAAVLAGDTALIEMFNRGADIHLTTAAEIYGRNPEDVTKQMRSAAKTINFGILYGMSPHGLSEATNMSMEQATTFINKYKQLRRPLFDYMEQLLVLARERGYVETLFGRRRPVPDINSRNFMVRTAAERAAINMPIQGTEADMVKLAMIKIDKLLNDQPGKGQQLLQIHDSVLVECPQDVADSVAKEIQQVMQSVYKLPVRLDVDVSIGDNWGQL